MRRTLSMLLALALFLLAGELGVRADGDEACTDCPESTPSCPTSCPACPCGRMVSPLLVQVPTLPPAPLHGPAGWTEPLPPPSRLHSRDVFQPPRV